MSVIFKYPPSLLGSILIRFVVFNKSSHKASITFSIATLWSLATSPNLLLSLAIMAANKVITAVLLFFSLTVGFVTGLLTLLSFRVAKRLNSLMPILGHRLSLK